MMAASVESLGAPSRPAAPVRTGRWGGHPTHLAQQRRWGALMLSPTLLILGLFTFVPIVLTFWISLHAWNMLTPITKMSWVGLSNYTNLFHDPTFRSSLLVTLVYVVIVVGITVPLSILVGMLLYFPRVRGKGVARTVLFTTYVIPTIAVAMVWGALYAPSYGPLAQMFHAVGLGQPTFLSSPSSALASLAAFNIWQMLGYYTVLVVAGLTQIPGDLYEAARVDGAGFVRQAMSITLPLLRRTTVFVVLIGVINAVQVFDPVYVLTQGGPITSTTVISYDIQRTAFTYGLAGEASAMAFSLLVLLVAVAVVILAFMRSR
jgi:ABC-type sugar transport system permease subunit